MKNQKYFTEDILFRNYMISSPYENYIHSQIPFYISNDCYNKMVYYSEEINKIALKVLNNINSTHKKMLDYIDEFPYKKEIFNLKCPISPMLWTRFDTFRESNGNIFFAELNYDKPCAQKEIALAGSMNFIGNINELFEINFKNEFVKICSKKNKYCNVGILIDPCHYEEFHLATYIKDLLKDINLTIYQVGPKNLSISENHVIAFEEIKLDVLVRLFPAEFSYEIDNFDKILKAFDDGNILILNDPRIVAIQAKALFAYLWELVLEDSHLLSYKEKNTIRNSLPFTKIFSKDDYNYVIKNKDNLVIKSSLGRYSGEVYLGKDFTPDNWKTQLDIILSSNKLHICQRLINIKKESTFRPIDEKSNLPTLAYANFGTFITKNKLIGICIRWSEDFLTNDESSFMCPLAIKDEPYYIEQYNYSDRKSKWNLINEESIFKYKFTGGYTNIYEYISLDKFIIKKEFYNEMLYASIEFCELLKKTNKLILENLSIFAPILGIDESLLPCIISSDSNFLCALGRIDFVIDIYNNLKILEFNSETPAGIIESTMITELISNEIYKNKTDIINPNVNLINSIKILFKDLINSLKSKSNIKNIAFLCTSYYEDLFNTSILIEILKDELEDISLLFGNIFDIEVIDNNVFLYGNKIDAIYRYYPLDWIVNEDELNKLIPLINKSVYFLNAPHTIVPQSKAYFAVIYELLKQGYYNNKESNFINKYIPLTSLTPLKNTGDFVIKPYLSREGIGITQSYQGIPSNIDDLIFQERINISPVEATKYSAINSSTSIQYPIIGIYIANDHPAGIFTRIGNLITDTDVVFMSSYIK